MKSYPNENAQDRQGKVVNLLAEIAKLNIPKYNSLAEQINTEILNSKHSEIAGDYLDDLILLLEQFLENACPRYIKELQDFVKTAKESISEKAEAGLLGADEIRLNRDKIGQVSVRVAYPNPFFPRSSDTARQEEAAALQIVSDNS